VSQLWRRGLDVSNMVDCSPKHSTAIKRIKSMKYTRMLNQGMGLTGKAGGAIIGEPLTKKCFPQRFVII